MELTFNWFKQKQKDCYGKKNYTFNKCALCTANITCSTRASKLVNFVNEYLITTMDDYLKGYTYQSTTQFSTHMVNSSHTAPGESAFKIFYKARRTDLEKVWMMNLYIAESIAVHYSKLELCVQKSDVQSLILP